MKLLLTILVVLFCYVGYGQKGADSCINCNFMGLTNEQWKIKDKPYWDSIDRIAIKGAGGIYIGDLPSSLCCFVFGFVNNYEVHIYHPSIDSTIVEYHYKRGKKNYQKSFSFPLNKQ